jgi:peptide/histidine transporter 3/4
MGEVAAADMYTQDGTVDSKGNPAVKKNTGNWRACPYILGTYTHDSIHFYSALLLSCCIQLYMRALMDHSMNLQRTNAASGWRTTA